MSAENIATFEELMRHHVVLWMGHRPTDMIDLLNERSVDFVAVPVADLFESEIICGRRRARGVDEARRLLDELGGT